MTKCDALIVEDHMEGSATSRMVQVAKGGTFLGEAEIETAEISGNFEGQGKIIAFPQVGGLHHRYERLAA